MSTAPEKQLAFDPDCLSVGDKLAIERTVLANERTLLAYIRTALALLVVGVSLIKFFTSSGMHLLGYTIIPFGIACLTIGLMRYTETRHHLTKLAKKPLCD